MNTIGVEAGSLTLSGQVIVAALGSRPFTKVGPGTLILDSYAGIAEAGIIQQQFWVGFLVISDQGVRLVRPTGRVVLERDSSNRLRVEPESADEVLAHAGRAIEGLQVTRVVRRQLRVVGSQELAIPSLTADHFCQLPKSLPGRPTSVSP